jgi:stage IV sporulation protein B
LELRSGTVTIESFDAQMGTAAQAAGLRAGDILTKINGKSIRCSDDVRQALQQSTGTVRITVRRGNKTETCTVKPQITADGPKLGLYLRQGVTGIGTVTWYDPQTGLFGTLGHGVNGSDGGLLPITGGNAYSARVVAVKKGVSGKPGQLVGAIENTEATGILRKNTAQGTWRTATAQSARNSQTFASWSFRPSILQARKPLSLSEKEQTERNLP